MALEAKYAPLGASSYKEISYKDSPLWPFGEMKGMPGFLGKFSPIDTIFRGAGQVVFMNNPVSGIFIITALLIFNWQSAFFGVLALIAGTTAAITMQHSGYTGFESHTDGIYGYNAFLVGLAIGTFSKDAIANDPSLVVHTAVVCIIFGILSALILNSLAKWMPIPSLTLAFNFSIIWFFGGTLAYSHMNTDLSPHLPVAPANVQTCLRSSATAECDMQGVNGFVVAALNGVCEIFFAMDTVSAVLIVVGMAFCSPLAALWAVLGSTVGLITGMLLGVDGSTLYAGLYGYNPSLTAIAVGAGIFGEASPSTYAWAVFGAVVTAFLHGTVAAFLSPVGVPAFTLPFCLATVFHLGSGVNKGS